MTRKEIYLIRDKVLREHFHTEGQNGCKEILADIVDYPFTARALYLRAYALDLKYKFAKPRKKKERQASRKLGFSDPVAQLASCIPWTKEGELIFKNANSND